TALRACRRVAVAERAAVASSGDVPAAEGGRDLARGGVMDAEGRALQAFRGVLPAERRAPVVPGGIFMAEGGTSLAAGVVAVTVPGGVDVAGRVHRAVPEALVRGRCRILVPLAGGGIVLTAVTCLDGGGKRCQ